MENNYYEQMISEISNTLSKVDNGQVNQLLEAIISSNRVFIAGAGRSGFILRCFAMRLMHLGLRVFVIGETTTPGISDRDLLLIGSGSGETSGVYLLAREAKKHNVKLGLITASPASTLASLADYKVLVISDSASVQPKGSLFEQSMLLVVDAMIVKLVQKLKVSPDFMLSNHANLE